VGETAVGRRLERCGAGRGELGYRKGGGKGSALAGWCVREGEGGILTLGPRREMDASST
jgi:hypothetical protein